MTLVAVAARAPAVLDFPRHEALEAVLIRTSAWLPASWVVAATLLAVGTSRAGDPEPWRRLASTPPFPPTISIPMGVYDPVRERVLALEVDPWNQGNQATPVFVFQPGPEPHWSVLPVSGAAPVVHYLASVVYDPIRDRLLMIGSTGARPVEVWSVGLAGTPAWQKLSTSGDPHARYGQSAIYDPVQDRIVMFGGIDWMTYPQVFMSETWSMSLVSSVWTQVATMGPTPHGREGHGVIYDPQGQRMLLFGGHYEDATRHFLNDLWELRLGDSTWSDLHPAGPLPGARSAFGTIYDPVRRRMLVHGGVNDQSGIEPDNLWALSLVGAPAWTPIVTEDALRGRSYPVDVYDPVADRLLACGGGDYPQTSALSLGTPMRWDAVLPPCCPLPSPGARSGHAVIFDSRRDRFLVIGGDYSSADSSIWIFRSEEDQPWLALRTGTAPYPGFNAALSQVAAYDSLGDRVIAFDGHQAWSMPAQEPGAWVQLGPAAATGWPSQVGMGAGVAIDSRRNRLIVSGGYAPYAHSAGFSLTGVWTLSLDANPAWSHLGDLPTSSYGHAAVYDAIRDELVVVGGMQVDDLPRSLHGLGAVAWSTPVDSVLRWTALSVVGDAGLPGPPIAHSTFDPQADRLYLANDSLVWTRQIDSPGPWTSIATSTPAPRITNPIAFDPVRHQLLALFASLPGSATVDAWALAVGSLSVSVLAADRSADAIAIRLRSVTAYGLGASLERREEGGSWRELGPLAFGIDGAAAFTDGDVHPGHDYHYRVSVVQGPTAWYSDEIFVPDPGSLRFALLGARPNPAVGTLQVTFTLPAAGPARLEVFDIHGRQRLSRDVGSMGPGIHAVRLNESVGWGPGLYYARLQRGGQTQSTRLVLLP